MNYREDTIKILDMICAKMIPFDIHPDDQEVILTEDDFSDEGFSYNSAILILKDIFINGSVNKFNAYIENHGKREVHMTVAAEMESYTKRLKYPETEYLNHSELMEPIHVLPSKITINIDPNKGIYKPDNLEFCYKIKNPSKRFDLIQQLIHKDKVFIGVIEENTGQKSSLIIKEIKDINSNFRKKLYIGYDLIIHINTGGYAINRDMFNIQT